jgi:hypothetical protein
VSLKFDTYSLKLDVYSLGKLPREYAGCRCWGAGSGRLGADVPPAAALGSGRLEGASPPPHAPIRLQGRRGGGGYYKLQTTGAKKREFGLVYVASG